QQQAPDDFDAWASQQEIDDDYDPALLEQQPWFQAELATTSSPYDKAQIDSRQGLPEEVSDPWSVPAQPGEEEVPPPPAWLDILNRNERRQPEQVPPTPQMPEPPSKPAYPA